MFTAFEYGLICVLCMESRGHHGLLVMALIPEDLSQQQEALCNVSVL